MWVARQENEIPKKDQRVRLKGGTPCIALRQRDGEEHKHEIGLMIFENHPSGIGNFEEAHGVPLSDIMEIYHDMPHGGRPPEHVEEHVIALGGKWRIEVSLTIEEPDIWHPVIPTPDRAITAEEYDAEVQARTVLEMQVDGLIAQLSALFALEIAEPGPDAASEKDAYAEKIKAFIEAVKGDNAYRNEEEEAILNAFTGQEEKLANLKKLHQQLIGSARQVFKDFGWDPREGETESTESILGRFAEFLSYEKRRQRAMWGGGNIALTEEEKDEWIKCQVANVQDYLESFTKVLPNCLSIDERPATPSDAFQIMKDRLQEYAMSMRMSVRSWVQVATQVGDHAMSLVAKVAESLGWEDFPAYSEADRCKTPETYWFDRVELCLERLDKHTGQSDQADG